jgi:hypothetical protein
LSRYGDWIFENREGRAKGVRKKNSLSRLQNFKLNFSLERLARWWTS